MSRALQTASQSVRFGPYEVNLDSGDLRKFGYRVKLQPKSFLVLHALLEAPGELVTREDLKAQLWPENTFVEFESSLNVAVRRLREALSDEAQKPAYIETVPRHGYRFIGILEQPAASALAPRLVADEALYSLANRKRSIRSPVFRRRPRLRRETSGDCCCRRWPCCWLWPSASSPGSAGSFCMRNPSPRPSRCCPSRI